MQLDYTKMNRVAEEKGLVIVDVAMDGDCALHAIIKQLQQQGIRRSYDARTLRDSAVHYLEAHSELVNLTVVHTCYGGDIRAYLRQQAVQGTLCDEAMIHAIATVTRTNICVFDDHGSRTTFEPNEAYRGKTVTLGRIADAHYVSLEARGAPSDKDQHKPDKFPSSSGASAASDDRLKTREADEGHKNSQDAVLRFACSRLKSEAEKRKLSVVDVPQTGDSALHAIVRQLQLQGIRLYDVHTLRQRALEYLRSHKHLIDKDFTKVQSYLSAQSDSGTPCDEPMLSAVSDVIMKEIHVLHDDGRLKKLGIQTSLTKSAFIGVYAKVHYVSLERSDSRQEHKTGNDMDTEPKHNSGHFVRPVTSSQTQKEETKQHAASSAADAATDKSPASASDTCAICMDVIKDPKTLSCFHVFCSQCIEQSMAYQPKCPCCGKIFGVLKGDQPEGGTMRVSRSKWSDLEGYPKCGRITIDYHIPDGRQKVLYSIICM